MAARTPSTRLFAAPRIGLAALFAALLGGPATLAAQPAPGGLPRTARERADWEALARAEDARAQTSSDLATVRALARSPSPLIRRLAVRALGRLERETVIDDAAAALRDSSAAVRAEAANAVAQAASHGGGERARAALLARLGAERDAAVIGALAEAAGRIAHADSAAAPGTANAIAAAAYGDEPGRLRGVTRGLYALARQPGAPPLPGAAVSRLTDALGHRRGSTDAEAARIRAAAASALIAGRAARGPTLDAIQADPASAVRRTALRAVAGAFAVPDSALARRIALRGLADSAPAVRAVAVPAYARRFAAAPNGCDPLRAAARDTALVVALQAADALETCGADPRAVALLDSLAASLPRPRGRDAGGWHLPAHALVALAAADSARARPRIAPYASSPDLFVREHAARAAARVRDTDALHRLARDAHPNVRTSALGGLARVVGHAADAVYVEALGSDDSQLLQAAAEALAGSRDARAVPALLDALDRVSRARRETSRDARVALLARVRELADAGAVPRVRRYLVDFDTLVAARAADVIGAWTGERPRPTPRPLPRLAVPTARDVDALARTRVRLEMADGGAVEVRLYPLDAPTNAARFVRMARAGWFDGLTFHRVVPARLVQGGSPAANEYAGDGPYTRDELARDNRRGAVGVSTRGRDTGDGQIYIMMVDELELDHNYTIFGEVVTGMPAVDRMQEGARIRRARVLP